MSKRKLESSSSFQDERDKKPNSMYEPPYYNDQINFTYRPPNNYHIQQVPFTDEVKNWTPKFAAPIQFYEQHDQFENNISQDLYKNFGYDRVVSEPERPPRDERSLRDERSPRDEAKTPKNKVSKAIAESLKNEVDLPQFLLDQCIVCKRKDFSLPARFPNCTCKDPPVICIDCVYDKDLHNCPQCFNTTTGVYFINNSRQRDIRYGPVVCPRCNDTYYRINYKTHKNKCFTSWCKFHKGRKPTEHFLVCACGKHICKENAKKHIIKECGTLNENNGCHFCCRHRQDHDRKLKCIECEMQLYSCESGVFPHICVKKQY